MRFGKNNVCPSLKLVAKLVGLYALIINSVKISSNLSDEQKANK